MFELFFKLLVGHALADFVLQTDVMATWKNRHHKPDIIPKAMPCWLYWSFAHALIHGGIVYGVTGSLLFGCVETIAHWSIDFAKCESWTNPHQDQILHLLCKIGYVLGV